MRAPEEYLRQWKELNKFWITWDSTWEELALFFLPSRQGFQTSWWPGQERSKALYEGLGLEANVKLANGIHGLMTNPSTTWANMRFREEALRDDAAAREWLEKCGKLIFAALNDSNFNTEVNEFYLDMGAFGLACLHAEPLLPKYGQDDNQFHGLWFHTYHLSEIRAAENAEGVLDTTYRKCKMTVEQAVEKFGLEPNPADKVRKGVSAKVKELYEKGDYYKEHEYLHCIHPRMLDEAPKFPAEPEDRQYASVYIDVQNKRVVMEDGLYEQARYMPRWLGRSDDWGGYGPGERALADSRSMNRARFLHFGAHEKLLDPPIAMKANNLIGDLNMGAKGISYLRDIDGVREWQVRPDVAGAMSEYELLRENVRYSFLWDALDLPRREEVGEMTAYEIAKRVEKGLQRLGPTVGRLQREFLNPMLKRVFAIMARRGALPEPPQSVIAAGGAAMVDIEYVGPLANAQRMEEVASADNWIARLAEAAQFEPEILDNVDFDEYAKITGQQSGVPEGVMRDTEARDTLRDERTEQQQQQQALDQAQQGTEIMGNAAQAGMPLE